jgi:hypothetical protein
MLGKLRGFTVGALGLGLLGLAAPASAALSIAPSKIALDGPGASQRLIVTSTDDAGREQDRTEDCGLRSSDPAIARVESAAVVAVSPGEVEIRAACDGAEAAIMVTVGQHAAGAMQVDFARDLLSILTTKGCNGSSCHGSPAGQNGFKLSLYGADPAADHRMIVEAADGRRVNLEKPAESLLLQKPTFAIAHGGGQLMTTESDEYHTLLAWIEQGARFDSSGAQLERLEIYPQERILVGTGMKQPLVVLGRLSDGVTRDMTAQVRFSVADTGVVSDVADAAVTAKGRGLTTVLARAMGKTAAAQFIVVSDVPSIETPEPSSFIDRHIFDKLRRVGIQPYPPSNDRVFVRRVFLDAIGMLPTPDEVDAFLSDSRPDKRARLIDDLLERPEYATQWLVKFEDWFRNSQYYSQGRTNGSYKRWLQDLIAEDKPYDRAAREMLTAVGDTTIHPAGNFWHPAMDFMLKTFDVTKATPTVTRLFLGERIECAQCHNHPLENLTQDDFYGMAAFLARMKVKHGYGQYRRIWFDAREGEVLHPNKNVPVAPRFLDGTTPDLSDGETRREALADWILEDQRLQFARATVNRIWYEYFGRGIVEPFDDFRSTNCASHPELLDELARYFIDAGFRFKALHRLILNSRAYQLSAHTPERPGGEVPLEDMLFARYVPRKLPAEVMLDVIVQVTGVDEEFASYPEGTSPKELIASIGATHFLTTFGTPRRDVMEPRSQAPSLAQSLNLMNGDEVEDKVRAEKNVLGELLGSGRSDEEVVADLYLRSFARPPSEREAAGMREYIAKEAEAGRDRRRAFENILWAILNSKEFELNR